jgi:hypothetical protein
MSLANFCRVSLGRTGLRGESGNWEDLTKSLKFKPCLEEVQREMNQKKGYARKSKKNVKPLKRQFNVTSNQEQYVKDTEGKLIEE